MSQRPLHEAQIASSLADVVSGDHLREILGGLLGPLHCPGSSNAEPLHRMPPLERFSPTGAARQGPASSATAATSEQVQNSWPVEAHEDNARTPEPLDDGQELYDTDLELSPEAGRYEMPSSSGARDGALSEDRGESGKGGKLRLQEKNRKAQQRFRARQKAKLVEKEEQVQGLMQQLSSLLDASKSLKSQNGLLSRMLQLGKSSADTRAQESAAQGPGPVPGSQTPKAFQGPPAPPPEPMHRPRAGPQGDDLLLTGKDGQQIRITTSQMETIPLESMKALWKQHVNALATVLMDLESCDSEGHRRRLMQLCSEACKLLLHFAAANPIGFKTLSASHLEDPMNGASGEDRDIWLVVMRTLMLSPQQNQELVKLRTAYVGKLALALQQRCSGITSLTNSQPCYLNAIHTSRRFLEVHHMTESVRQTLQEEHGLLLEFLHSCCDSVLSPTQTAQLIVQSYPWLPDIVSISSWVAYELDDTGVIHTMSAQPTTTPLSWHRPNRLPPAPGPHGPALGPQGSPLGPRGPPPSAHAMGPQVPQGPMRLSGPPEGPQGPTGGFQSPHFPPQHPPHRPPQMGPPSGHFA